MYKLNFFGGVCCITLTLVHLPLLASIPLTRIKRNQVHCEQPLGRILSKGDRHFAVGSLICNQDKLEVLNNSSVQFLCFSSGNILNLSSGIITIDKCSESSQDSSACSLSNTNTCQIRKGGREGGVKPTIVSPYTSSTFNPRPKIIWRSVLGATSYKVRVNGYEFQWEKIINQTQLDYPTDEKEWQAGNTYRIDVFAYKDGYPISTSSRVITLLSVSSQREIAQKVEQIKRLGLPLDEAALDIDTVYTSRNLLNETIEMLNERLATPTGSQSPSIHRVLGDRYLKVWLLDEAKREYTTAVELAKSSNNLKELKKAQEGLKLIDFYNQLPISRNGAQ